MKKLLFFTSLFIFFGCSAKYQEPSISELRNDKRKDISLVSSQDIEKFKKKITQSNDLLKASWTQSGHILPLTVYIQKPTSKMQQLLLKTLQKMQKDPVYLKRFGIENRFSSINIVVYEYGLDTAQKIEAIYQYRLFSKEKLADIIRHNDKKEYQEFSITIDSDLLKENKLHISGFKAVTTKEKELNCGYYHLVKRFKPKEYQNELENALYAIFHLSIPEYISIQREDIKNDQALKIVSQQKDGTYLGSVYKVKLYHMIEQLEKQRKEALRKNPNQVKNINAYYDQKIAMIQNSKKWIEYQTRQLLYTSPILQKDIDTLFHAGYISKKFNAKALVAKEANEIAFALDMNIPDYYLTLAYEPYQEQINQFHFNIGDIQKIGDTYFIKSKIQVENDIKTSVSSGMKNSVIAVANGVVTSVVALGGLRVDEVISYTDTAYKYVKPKEQKGKLYLTSKFNYEDIGIEKIYQEKFYNFDHSLMTIQKGKPFYIDLKKKQIAILTSTLDDNKSKVIYFSIPMMKQVAVKNIIDDTIFQNRVKHGKRIGFLESRIAFLQSILKNKKTSQRKKYEQSLKKYKKEYQGLTQEGIVYFHNNYMEISTCGIPSHQKEIMTFSEEFESFLIHYYLCGNSFDLFDKEKRFVYRNQEHSGYLHDIKGIDKLDLIITSGKRSSKIWSMKAMGFIARKF